MAKVELIISNLNELQSLASKLAKIIKFSDTITLSGELGAGKTTFTQFFLNSMADDNIEVTSPTFNLLQIYQINNCEIWHYDLYRLNDKSEAYELGIEEAFDKKISIIEWPEIIYDLLPLDRLELKIEFMKDSLLERKIIFTTFGNWQERLGEVINVNR